MSHTWIDDRFLDDGRCEEERECFYKQSLYEEDKNVLCFRMSQVLNANRKC